jgi:hypothetical protein
MAMRNSTIGFLAVDYAKSFRRMHDAVMRVYDDVGNVIATHEQAGNFKE